MRYIPRWLVILRKDERKETFKYEIAMKIEFIIFSLASNNTYCKLPKNRNVEKIIQTLKTFLTHMELTK